MTPTKAEFLANEELISALEDIQGLIPTAINAEAGELIWTNLGTYHFYEGFFRKSLVIYKSLSNEPITMFRSQLDILCNDKIQPTRGLKPQGFIFHAGHCGSTALTKALGRSRNNLILSEATPISQLFSVFTRNSEMPIAKQELMLKNLMLAMCRKRVASHQAAFFKFSSHNIHFFELIHSIFPEVPAIFLKRGKTAIVNSFRKRPAGWMRKGMDLDDTIQGFLNKADSIDEGSLLKFEHQNVNAENLSSIISHFQLYPCQEELELMQSQFKYDSKVEFNLRIFEPER